MPITDKISRVTDSTTGRPVVPTLAAPGHTIGGTSVSISSATNWTTTTAIHFSMYTTKSIGGVLVKDTTTQTDWKGTLSGTTISNMTLTGGTDRNYSAGSIVELTPTAAYAKELYDHVATEHNQDGTHKSSLVAMLAGAQTFSGVKTFSSIPVLPASSIGSPEIATDSHIVAYVEGLTTGQSTTSASFVDATGITVTFTTPASCTKVLLRAEGPCSSNTDGIGMLFAITDSANAIQVRREVASAGASAALISTFTLSKRITVTASTSYTFKLRFASNGTATTVINNGNDANRMTCIWVERA